MPRHILRVPLQGGKPVASPQFREQASSLGLNPDELLKEVQEYAKKYGKFGLAGIEVEVSNGRINIVVQTPPIGEMILKAVGKPMGSHASTKEIIGDVSLETLAEIAVTKYHELKSKSFKSALKQVVSTCKTLGVTVDGKSADEVIRLIDSGAYDETIKKYEGAVLGT